MRVGQRNDLASEGMTSSQGETRVARETLGLEMRMPKIEWRSILALLTAGLIVSTGTPIAAPSISTAVATASGNIADELTATDTGPHLGFDTFAYPGDDAMRAWLTADKYRWVGYYLPAPCHNDDSWAGKRDTLSDMGWGMAVIYVGQQTWGRTPGQKIAVTRYVTKRVKQTVRTHSGKRAVRYVNKRVPVRALVSPRASPGSSCSTQLVSAARGIEDANDAIARTAAEGFAKGTVVFLDIERMDLVPKAMRDYYKAWTQRVLDDGRFRPGYYAHSYNADLIYRDVKQVLSGDGISTDPPFWIASTQGFATDKLPSEVGHAFAQVWQGVLDIVETHNGVRLPIDVNVAQLASPSEGYRAGE